MNLMFRKLKELKTHQCHFLQALKNSEHGFDLLQAQHAQKKS